MTSSEADLPDANLWLALTVAGHAHHAAAQAWVSTRVSRPLVFCRITQMALLRHLTTVAIMGAEVCSQQEAWRIYDAALDRPEVYFLSEAPTVEEVWRARTASTQPATRQWTDQYLAAFAHSQGLRLVTFDRGMAKYGGADVLVLESKA